MAVDRPATDFGSKLREARERRGISLRQIANATKISVRALEALERNDISRLPGGIFSRAFVRSYAVEVGLDPEATIQDFVAYFPHDSVTAGHPTSNQGEDPDDFESSRRVASTLVGLVTVSVVVIGALLYFGVVGRGTAPPPAATVAEPPTKAPEPSASAAAGAADSAGRAAAVPTGTSADTGSAASGSALGSAPPAPAVVPREEASAPGAEGRLAIAVTATRPCWVSATVDGQKAIERLLQPGDQRVLDVSRELVLTAGDAAALTLTLNGANAKPLGNAGEVVTVRLNLANFKEYLQVR
jgi:cytoskeleton protein RodZ